MKRFAIFLILFMAFGGKMYAQTGLEGFNYQTIVRDNAGIPIVNKAINFRFSILDGGVNGAPQYIETQLITTNSTGLVNHIVGKGTPVSGTFSAIPFENANQYLKVEADINGGNAFQSIGALALMSVPYAQFAAKGNVGPQGPKGDAGPQGVQGATGPQGPPGYGVVKLMSYNTRITDVPLDVNPIYPNEFKTPSYLAGSGEYAVINMDISIESTTSNTTILELNVGVSIDGSVFTKVPGSFPTRFSIESAHSAFCSISLIYPLTTGSSYSFGPELALTSNPKFYNFVTGHGTVMIIKQ